MGYNRSILGDMLLAIIIFSSLLLFLYFLPMEGRKNKEKRKRKHIISNAKQAKLSSIMLFIFFFFFGEYAVLYLVRCKRQKQSIVLTKEHLPRGSPCSMPVRRQVFSAFLVRNDLHSAGYLLLLLNFVGYLSGKY